MTIYKNDRQHIKSYLFVGVALIAGTAIAAELMPEPSIAPVDAPAEFTADNPTDVYTLEQANATDKASQLIWSRCLVGQTFTDGACQGEPTEFTSWQAAIDATQLQAKDGWRLPNIKELVSITETTQVFPAINTSVFPFAKNLRFYNHEETREKPDYGKWVPQAEHAGQTCTEDEWGRMTDQAGWTCLNPQIPAKYIPEVSSPYIWSSTPVAYIPYQKPSWGEPLPLEEQEAQNEKSRKSANFVYALDLAEGTPNQVTRDGIAIGETDEGKYSDVYKEKRARYILLVKDMS
ncbi:DUF1566 domain-containing protein [Psychrobacter sp. I-STPA6b]|uniref:Lcl C-terminal domain-containing protein n=1 Tax=Psychrobacter sp. I-STPA6b TaxID=2585718 RepID=UPI001D0C172D|nr:DUF1566 domain-containing protein [Psychrobacter sp. I-STPA6b]